jgi:type I restriction enzyme S subunit
MPNNWKTYKLGELYKSASGLSKSSKEFGFGNPFVSFKNVFYNYFLPNELDSLVNTNEKEIKSCSVLEGDVFLTRTSETLGELGMSSVALKDYPKATFNGFCKRLRVIEDAPINIDPLYFGFYLRSEKFRNEVTKLASITTRASLNNDAIYSIEVKLPTQNEQIEIGKILKSINDKIENNLAINKTLEDMAMTLYKHWFVDFDPFQNEEFVESELGMIPKGWEVKSIGNVVETLGGGTPSTTNREYWDNGDICWYSPTDLTRQNSLFSFETAKKITPLGLQKSSAKMFPANSLLMSSRATIGLLTINTEKACTNQGFITMLPNEKLTVFQLYFWVKENMDLIISKCNGSTFKEISKSNFRDLKIIVANETVDYIQQSKDIFDQIKNNTKENQTLTQLRDTLLPKLISGEVRLKEYN